jgi:hypothetical protein
MKNKFIIAALCLIASLTAVPASAQFVGYVTPQTVGQTLATNTACTGSAQIFVTANLGQTQHYVSVKTNAAVTQMQVEIDGVDVAGNTYRISDQLMQPITGQAFTVTGSGYYPKTQISVTCVGTGTFSLFYSGASATSNVNAGAYQIAQIDKVLYFGDPQNATVSTVFQPPFLNTSGTIYFFYGGGTSVSGSSLQITCQMPSGLTAATTLFFPLANNQIVQAIPIPATPCSSLETVEYSSLGGGTGTISADYVFNPPGSQDSLVCSSTKFISALGLATAQIVSAVNADQRIRVCSVEMSNTNATATNLKFVEGTGTNCGTNQTQLTGNFSLGAAPSNVSFTPTASGAIITNVQGDALCVTGSAAGAADVTITFVQF